MDNCANCGKELKTFLDKHMSHNQIDRKYPDNIWKGKKLCRSCTMGITSGGISAYSDKEVSARADVAPQQTKATSPFRSMKDSQYAACIDGLGLLENEEIKLQYVCVRSERRQSSNFDGTPRIENRGRSGLLVFTNDNMIFMQKQGFSGKDYSQALRIPLENVSGMVVGGTFFKDIRIKIGTSGLSEEQLFSVFKDNRGRLAQVETVKREIETVLKQAREEKNRAKAKEHVQIVVDFYGLKDTLAKGGIVMTTCNCPKCNATVEIPEAGKVLICKYCGTPIKPLDIFAKIKSLIE